MTTLTVSYRTIVCQNPDCKDYRIARIATCESDGKIVRTHCPGCGIEYTRKA
jgi:hypothetical protein